MNDFIFRMITHVHLWSAAAQQVYESRVKGHDGVTHVDDIIIIFIITA